MEQDLSTQEIYKMTVYPDKDNIQSDETRLALSRLCGIPMETERFLTLAIQCVESLEEIHGRNIICGNITPDMIHVNSISGRVSIVLRQQDLSRSGLQGYDLKYVSPEQTGRMNCPVDSRTDIYSLGVVFYELLTGSTPFTAADPLELVYFHLARTAVPPATLAPSVPAVISDIVMKLISKAPEERYQTALGLKTDLQECYDRWHRTGMIERFQLGQYDIPDHLLIPQKLYGREDEINLLLQIFERIVDRGKPEYVFVAGYSGIGKTSLVRELHKPVVRERGLFISGKFDQYKRNIPYATITEAFRGLVQQILAEDKLRIDTWRQKLMGAMGTNARLIADIIPEIELITGRQPPVRELPPKEAQKRFNAVFQQFIGVFTEREHPLVLFLDDLQWSDEASLSLISLIAVNPDIKYLLFIGAYRDNEVDPSHSLMKVINNLKLKEVHVTGINLLPLSTQEINELISDAFQVNTRDIENLGRLIFEKTAGIPFFVIQFLYLLYDEGLLVFNKDKRIWAWDIKLIQERGYTDNVVDLMVKQLLRFPAETQDVLKMAACIGNRFELDILAAITSSSAPETLGRLDDAIRKGLVLSHSDLWFSFLHDRVQQAAYSLIPEDMQASVHLHIGTLMLQQVQPELLEEKIFDIVNQMNRGHYLIDAPGDKEHLAELNLMAGKKAKESIAYSSAVEYLSVGTRLLPPDHWETLYDLSYELFLNLAECMFMNGELDEAEHLLSLVIAKARTKNHLARASYIKVYLYHVKGASSKGAETAIECLKQLGFELSLNPTREQARAEYDMVWQNLGNRDIGELINLPAMTDPDMLMAIRMLGVIYVPAVYTNINLAIMLLSIMVNISMKYGNSDISPLGYVAFGELIGPEFSDYQRGYCFGQLGYDIVEKTDSHPFRGQVDFQYAQFINPYINHISTSINILERAFHLTVAAGDLPFACYCCQSIVTDHLVNGTPLNEVYIDSEKRLKFVLEGKFKISEIVIRAMQQFIKNLQGLTDHMTTFNDPDFNQAEFETYLEENREALAIGVVRYYIRKLQACYFRGDYGQGFQLIDRIVPYLWTMPSFMEVPEYYYYASLILAAYYKKADDIEKLRCRDTLIMYCEQMRIWSKSCPVNFRCKYTLVSAEIAGISGDDLQAMQLYEESIRSAGESGFIHNQAMAYEAAARFYHGRGYELFARIYYNEARECYYRWGAHGKVKEMEKSYIFPEIRDSMMGSSNLTGRLDAISVVKASQAISGEIMLDRLLEILMKTVLENAGAQRGYLIQIRDHELSLQVKAEIEGENIKVSMPAIPEPAGHLPVSVINYVRRSRNSVILDDAREINMFSGDPYMAEKKPVSVLCLPVLRKAKLIGSLYLENNLIKGAFTRDRIAVLELLSAQAAISLENASLYLEQMYMEDKLKELNQRLADIIDFLPDSTFVLDKERRVIAWNKAIEELTGITKEQIVGRGDYEYAMPFYNARRPLIADMILGDDGEIESGYDFVKRSGDTITGEVFAPMVNRGTGAYLMVVASPLRDRHGVIVGVIESIRDITERKKAEDTNLRLHKLLRNTIDSMTSIIIGINSSGAVNQWNIEAEHFTGISRDGAMGKMIHMVFPVINRFNESLNEALLHNRVARQEKFSISIDGKNQYYNLNIYPLAGKHIEGAVIRMDDITETQQKEEQLLQAQKMETVGTLAGGLAHDFNNVLSGIVGTVSLMKHRMEREKVNKDQMISWIEIIEKSSSRAAEMVNRLLVLSRKHEVSLIPMDINTALRNVMQICANSFDKSITLHPEYSDGAAMIEGVPAQIEQVMLNLCVNASHAMTMMRAENEKRGGALTVSVKKIRADRLFCKTHPKARMINYWLVSHADTGAGIDRQNLNKIFDPFFTTKEKGTGTGLGLAMAYNIIHQHNGFIDVYSEKGMGSTFNIYLPEYMVTDPSQEQHGEDQEIIRGRGLILIVDDESVVRLIARDILTECGYDVLMAEDGRRGIELFRENQDLISAVLLDMAMPGMSGDEVLIELRKIQTDVKVLLTSGFRQDSRMEKALSLGNAVFIQKPYSIYEMSRKIKEITDMTG